MQSGTNKDIQLHQASTADLANLVYLSKTTFYESFAADNTPENMSAYLAAHFSDAVMLAELEDKSNVFFIATCNRQAAGYAKLRKGPGPEGLTDHALELQRIYVLQAFHNQKVGAALLRHCLDTATHQGYDTVWLGVWEHNTRAIDFYTRWGFEQFGSHPFIFGDDTQTDLLMKKHLI
jgi:ribosomal protein S18 acetylase RimI-like enzyme